MPSDEAETALTTLEPARPSATPAPTAHPVTRWPVLLAGGAVAALVIAWLVRTVLRGGDWTAGARAVAATAFLLTALAIVAAVLVARRERGNTARLVRYGLLVVLLAAIGIGSLVAAAPLHGTQARYSEARGLWSDAIQQYGATGESGPNAPNIARVYNAWGEQLLHDGHYGGAVARFTTVTTDYAKSGGEVERASRDLYNAYRAWIQADAPHVTYDGALAAFTRYLADPTCDSTCQSGVRTVSAQAHYEYGRQLASAKRYADAVAQFEMVQAQYGQSAYAAQAHTAAATTYLALGHQQIAASATCASAVGTYKTLLARYATSPEANTARTEMAAPQGVSGTFTGLPTSPLPVVHLSKSGNADAYSFSNDYSAQIDAANGAFTFKGVKQGTYYLSTTRDKGSAISYTYYTNPKGGLYKVVVAPLCTTQLGKIVY